jgi:adenine-specific DNA-methyltransferase
MLIADQAGSAYVAAVSAAHRKAHGLYLTPVEVAAFMAAQLQVSQGAIRILDPAAGAGVLLCAAVEAMVADPAGPRDIEVVAYELDPVLAQTLTKVLANLTAWSTARGTTVRVSVVQADFVLAHAPALRAVDGLFSHLDPAQAFVVVIANQPYL